MNYDPRYYDPLWVATEQSPIPSQNEAPGTPYFPELIVETAQTTAEGLVAAALSDIAAEKNNANGITSYTRHVYESRPPMAVDFLGPVNDGTKTAIQVFDGSFTVPQGYVGIVRGVYFNTSSALFTTTSFGVFSPAGANGPPRITLLRNGVPIFGYTNVSVGLWGMSAVTLPCFVMLNAGETISGRWNEGIVSYAFGNGFAFYGQLLLDDGRNLPLQAGNMWPEPVTEVEANAAGVSAPPGGPPDSGPPSATPGVAMQPQSVATDSNYFEFKAPFYPGPFPPTVGVDTYNALRERHHIQVRQAYLAMVRTHPGAIINVTGATGDALAPAPGE